MPSKSVFGELMRYSTLSSILFQKRTLFWKWAQKLPFSYCIYSDISKISQDLLYTAVWIFILTKTELWNSLKSFLQLSCKLIARHKSNNMTCYMLKTKKNGDFNAACFAKRDIGNISFENLLPNPWRQQFQTVWMIIVRNTTVLMNQ